METTSNVGSCDALVQQLGKQHYYGILSIVFKAGKITLVELHKTHKDLQSALAGWGKSSICHQCNV
jgi:hypothetical protein